MSAQPLSERVLRVAQRPLGIRHDVQDKKPPQGSIVKHTCGYMNGDGPKPRCQCSSISSSEARMLVQAGWDWLRATRSNGSPYVFHGAIVPRQRPAPQLTPRKQEKTLAAVRRDLQLALAAGKNSEPPQSWKHNASRPSGSINPSMGPGEGGPLSMLPQPAEEAVEARTPNFISRDANHLLPGAESGVSHGSDRVPYKPSPTVDLTESVPLPVIRKRSVVAEARAKANATRDGRVALGRGKVSLPVVD